MAEVKSNAPEFKGAETLYLIDIPQPDGKTTKTVRFLTKRQVHASIEAGEIELKRKIRGSDYGDVTQSASIEGFVLKVTRDLIM